MPKSKVNSKSVPFLEVQNLLAQQEHKVEGRSDLPASILGVDYGEKFTGLAWAHQTTIVPLGIFSTKEINSLDPLKDLCETKKIELIIYGLPLSSDQSENHICKAIRKFAQDFYKKKPLPFEFINERFSSQMTLSPDKKSRCDDLAAMQILEFFLARKSCPKRPSIL